MKHIVIDLNVEYLKDQKQWKSIEYIFKHYIEKGTIVGRNGEKSIEQLKETFTEQLKETFTEGGTHRLDEWEEILRTKIDTTIRFGKYKKQVSTNPIKYEMKYYFRNIASSGDMGDTRTTDIDWDEIKEIVMMKTQKIIWTIRPLYDAKNIESRIKETEQELSELDQIEDWDNETYQAESELLQTLNSWLETKIKMLEQQIKDNKEKQND